ncbi:isoprenyl transferase [Falsarthrobacter nasiphocae]|uniref:Isoprenyl transferase n=1 Tax=Falsarthrobacter nasiphocae TaxID=189863 RepID=A0AAE3YE03_9MICC|nr:isoprenyl transferase [Falsarthrobacter nasiphocae]MDR6891644.1 short-chain Z-isoprenyl diphosphate synthase [Falsarthrobacter nasiphocae]
MQLRRALYGLYSRQLRKEVAPAVLPRHIGVMVDGNRRWAKLAGAPTHDGHQAGADKIIEFLGWCRELRIPTVTLYMLSTDNLSRSSDELDALIDIIGNTVDRLAETPRLRVCPVGALEILPPHLVSKLESAAAQAPDDADLRVNVAVGYGGRREIVDAVREILLEAEAEGKSVRDVADALTDAQIGEHLYTRGQPDPDLVIRTSGEQRLSGFLMWQSAYSEFYFCEALWPDFRRVDFLRALRDFASRQRRFGA